MTLDDSDGDDPTDSGDDDGDDAEDGRVMYSSLRFSKRMASVLVLNALVLELVDGCDNGPSPG